jgi:hypothetical protein
MEVLGVAGRRMGSPFNNGFLWDIMLGEARLDVESSFGMLVRYFDEK